MPIRRMTVYRRIVGTVNQAEEFHLHYVVRTDDATEAKAADFRALDLLGEPGAPSEATFANVSGAVRLYGRTLAGKDGSEDEETEFESIAGSDDFVIWYRSVPSTGTADPRKRYLLSAVKAAPGAPSEADFDAVVDAIIAYGDDASGYA